MKNNVKIEDVLGKSVYVKSKRMQNKWKWNSKLHVSVKSKN